MLADFRYTVRRLVWSPGFALAATLTLALGIGINVAVLSVVNAIIWKPLAVSDSSRLVVLEAPRVDETPAWLSDLRRRSLVTVEGLAGYRFVQTAVVVGERADVVKAEAVAGDYFETLGVTPLAGRVLTSGDGPSVTAISESFWREWFGADPAAVGATITVAGRPAVVVGIVPAAFQGLHGGHVLGNDLWIPADVAGDELLNVFGRLQSGQTFSQASAEFALLSPDLEGTAGLELVPFDESYSESPAAFLGVSLVSLALSGLVLLTMAVNVVGLFAARQAERAHEYVTRMVLGASDRQILSLVTWEVALIVVAASAGGALLGQTAVGPIGAWSFQAGDALAFQVTPSVDWRVFSWLVLASVATTATIAGLIRTRVGQAGLGMQRVGTGAAAGTPGLAALRRRLIGLQVACVLVLLLTSSLFVRSVTNRHLPVEIEGIDRKVVAWVGHEMQGYGPDDWSTAIAAVEQELEADSEIAAVAITTVIDGSARRRLISARTSQSSGVRAVDVHASASFPGMLGRAVVEGRIDPDGWVPQAGTAAIDEQMASRLFPAGGVVGRVILLGPDDTPTQVVAVVASLPNDDRPMVFRPNGGEANVAIVVEGRVAAERLVPTVQNAFARVRPEVVPHDVRTLAEQVGSTTGALRSAAVATGWLGALAGAVALVGIYGTVMSLTVQRRREFGIRRALGATNGAIYKLAAGELALVLAIGGGAGIVATAVVGLGLTPFFRGLQAFDLASFVVVPLALTAASMVAALLPVTRSLAVPPQRWLKDL